MTYDSDKLFLEIADDIAIAWQREGDEIVQKIQNDLSVPVQIEIGPRGGRKIIRSKRGEHPRRESGKLQSEMQSVVQRDGVNCNLIIEAPTYYAEYLDPKDALDRPIIRGIGEEFEEKMADITVQAIQGNG